MAFTGSAIAAARLPPIEIKPLAPARPGQRTGLARPIRLTRFATAAVRLLNGYLVVLVAFALRDSDAGALDFGFLVAAAGFGYLVAAMLVPLLDGRIAEEPMVIAALAVEALAAFIAAQAFGFRRPPPWPPPPGSPGGPPSSASTGCCRRRPRSPSAAAPSPTARRCSRSPG